MGTNHFAGAMQRPLLYAAGAVLAVLLVSLCAALLAPYSATTASISSEYCLGAVRVGGSVCSVLVSDSSPIARYFGHLVHAVHQVDLHCQPAQGDAHDYGVSAEDVKHYLDTAGFYFSPTGDFTQHAGCLSDPKGCPKGRRNHFAANQHMLDTLAGTADIYGGAVAVRAVLGFVGGGCVAGGGCAVVVSRSAVQRCSTRFAARGGDLFGNVANFVETEVLISGSSHDASGSSTDDSQLPTVDKDAAQFLTIRGSVPLKWSQAVDISKAVIPPIHLHKDDDPADKAVFKAHLKLLHELYGGMRVGMLSLLEEGESSREFPLAKRFSQIAGDQLLRFNYNKELKRADWKDRLLALVTSNLTLDFAVIRAAIHKEQPTRQPTRQSTMLRVNCLDSLDRTNSVQSTIAAHLYPAMLKSIHSIPPPPHLLYHFIAMMRVLWAENADALSLHNAGSKALKADVGKKGRRTAGGKVRDWRLTLWRYFNAYWGDGKKGDCMQVVYGAGSL